MSNPICYQTQLEGSNLRQIWARAEAKGRSPRRAHIASTPLVLGTSSPLVRVIAIRIARAMALNADSALSVNFSLDRHMKDVIRSHVVIVLPSNEVNMHRHSGSEGE